LGYDLGRLPHILRWGVMIGLSVLAIGLAEEYLVGDPLLKYLGLFIIVITPASFLIALSFRMFLKREYGLALLPLLTLLMIAVSAILAIR